MKKLNKFFFSTLLLLPHLNGTAMMQGSRPVPAQTQEGKVKARPLGPTPLAPELDPHLMELVDQYKTLDQPAINHSKVNEERTKASESDDLKFTEYLRKWNESKSDTESISFQQQAEGAYPPVPIFDHNLYQQKLKDAYLANKLELEQAREQEKLREILPSAPSIASLNLGMKNLLGQEISSSHVPPKVWGVNSSTAIKVEHSFKSLKADVIKRLNQLKSKLNSKGLLLTADKLLSSELNQKIDETSSAQGIKCLVDRYLEKNHPETLDIHSIQFGPITTHLEALSKKYIRNKDQTVVIDENGHPQLDQSSKSWRSLRNIQVHILEAKNEEQNNLYLKTKAQNELINLFETKLFKNSDPFAELTEDQIQAFLDFKLPFNFKFETTSGEYLSLFEFILKNKHFNLVENWIKNNIGAGRLELQPTPLNSGVYTGNMLSMVAKYADTTLLKNLIEGLGLRFETEREVLHSLNLAIANQNGEMAHYLSTLIPAKDFLKASPHFLKGISSMAQPHFKELTTNILNHLSTNEILQHLEHSGDELQVIKNLVNQGNDDFAKGLINALINSEEFFNKKLDPKLITEFEGIGFLRWSWQNDEGGFAHHLMDQISLIDPITTKWIIDHKRWDLVDRYGDKMRLPDSGALKPLAEIHPQITGNFQGNLFDLAIITGNKNLIEKENVFHLSTDEKIDALLRVLPLLNSHHPGLTSLALKLKREMATDSSGLTQALFFRAQQKINVINDPSLQEKFSTWLKHNQLDPNLNSVSPEEFSSYLENLISDGEFDAASEIIKNFQGEITSSQMERLVGVAIALNNYDFIAKTLAPKMTARPRNRLLSEFGDDLVEGEVNPTISLFSYAAKKGKVDLVKSLKHLIMDKKNVKRIENWKSALTYLLVGGINNKNSEEVLNELKTWMEDDGKIFSENQTLATFIIQRHLSGSRHYTQVMKFLEEFPLDLEAPSASGKTPLLIALEAGRMDLAQMIAKKVSKVSEAEINAAAKLKQFKFIVEELQPKN